MLFAVDKNRNPHDENLNVGIKEMIDFSLYSRKGLKLLCSSEIFASDSGHLIFSFFMNLASLLFRRWSNQVYWLG